MLPVFQQLGYPMIAPLERPNEPRPFWSVVVPVHKRTTYLAQCLASVQEAMRRDGLNYELLVVDSSPTPIRLPVLDQYTRLTHINDLGPMDNWNWGLGQARGHWTHLLNDDDFVRPDFYRELRRGIEWVAQQGGSVGAACTGYTNEDNSGRELFRNHRSHAPTLLKQEEWLRIIGTANPLNTPAVVIARSTYELIGGFDPENSWCPDWELYRRSACVTTWWSEPSFLAVWRQHGEQGNRAVNLEGKYKSILRTAELGKHYFPAHLSGEIEQSLKKHWLAQAKEEAEYLISQGHQLRAWTILHAASVLE